MENAAHKEPGGISVHHNARTSSLLPGCGSGIAVQITGQGGEQYQRDRAHERGACVNRRANHRMARTTATMASVSLTPPAATYR